MILFKKRSIESSILIINKNYNYFKFDELFIDLNIKDN